MGTIIIAPVGKKTCRLKDWGDQKPCHVPIVSVSEVSDVSVALHVSLVFKRPVALELSAMSVHQPILCKDRKCATEPSNRISLIRDVIFFNIVCFRLYNRLTLISHGVWETKLDLFLLLWKRMDAFYDAVRIVTDPHILLARETFGRGSIT